MFSKKQLLAFSVGFAIHGAALEQTASAANETEKRSVSGKASVLPPAREKPSYGVSATTGWRNIDGWEQGVVERDPNLKNWSWLGMQEMNKGYIRLRPGQVGVKRPSRYPKTVHVRSIVKAPRVVHVAPMNTERRYLQPTHLPLPSRDSVAARAKLNRSATLMSYSVPSSRTAYGLPNTGAGLSVPRTNVRLGRTTTGLALAAPGTHLRLSAPAAGIGLASPNTSARLAVPSTGIGLAAPNTCARPAVSSTGVRLALPSSNVSLVSSQARGRLCQPAQSIDAMAEVGHALSADQFAYPGTETRSPYEYQNGNGFLRAAATVRGRVVK